MKKYSLRVLFVCIICVLLSACGKSDNTNENKNKASGITTEALSDRQFLMGTYVEIKIYQEGKEEALSDAFERVKSLADKITVNEPDSEIDDINEQAGVQPVKVSQDILYLMNEAYAYSSIENSGFDMAIGPITQLWRIGFPEARKPSQGEIDSVLPLVNYKDVIIDNENQTVFLTKKGMSIDLGAIAKGYITDEVVKVLKSKGVSTAIIDLGGNVFVMGKSPNTEKDWKIGIQDPAEERYTVLGNLPASNQSIVTSGIYERFFEFEGIKYHHIFNSKTGYPVDNNLASVTVVSNQSIDGDGLTTVLFAKGVEDGLKYIEEKKDVEAIFVTKDKKVFASSGIWNEITMDDESGYTLEKMKQK